MDVRLSAPYRLLCPLVRSEGDPGIVLRAPDADWKKVVRLADWHGVAPIAFTAACRLATPPPQEPLDALRERYMRSSALAMQQRSELAVALAALDRAGIDAMLLKGAALVECVYPDPGQRPMADVDLLVREPAIEDAVAAIRDAGFTTPSWNEHPAGHYHAPPLVPEDGVLVVELHTGLVGERSPEQLDIHGMWDRAVRLGPGRFLPSPEDLLHHVCVHFVHNRRHGSRGALLQLCDIAEIMRRFPISGDTGGVAVRAAVWLGVSSAAALLGGEVTVPHPPPGGDEGLLAEFVRRRVLHAAPWLPVEHLRGSKQPLRRAFPKRAAMSARVGSERRGALPAAYVRRALRGLRLAWGVVAAPRAALANRALNRRLYLLAREKTRRATP